MNHPFDTIASKYDKEFSGTLIGKSQRHRVWKYLNKILTKKSSLNILELNCGTGIDALYLTGLGHDVVATDVSIKMHEIAKSKSLNRNSGGVLKYEILDLKNPDPSMLNSSFDIAFSNFGGLNCLDKNELRILNEYLAKRIKKGGDLIVNIMPRFPFMQILFSIYKCNRQNLKKRRKRNEALYVNVDHVREMIHLTRHFGIEAGTFIMLGYPGETEKDIKKTVKHLKDSNPDHFTITIAYPIKGTSLYEEVETLQTKNLDWTRTTDRNRDFKRTYTRIYYRYAVSWVTNEFEFYKQTLRKKTWSLAAMLHKIKAITARTAMIITRLSTVPFIKAQHSFRW